MPGIGFHLFDPAFVGTLGVIIAPEELDNLFIHLDAADGPIDVSDVPITVDGTACKTWTDLQGNFSITQGVAGARPLWKENIINGLPVIRFDGSDDLLGNNGASAFAKPCTMFLVVRMLTVEASVAFATGVTGLRWGIGSFDVVPYGNSFMSWEQGGTDVHKGYSSSDWVILARVYHDTAAKIALNTTTMTNVGSVGTSALQGLWLGGYSTGANTANCEIAEYLQYSVALTDGECASAITYLSNKYAIALNGNNGWGAVGSEDFESYAADDAIDGKTGGTSFNGAWEGH